MADRQLDGAVPRRVSLVFETLSSDIQGVLSTTGFPWECQGQVHSFEWSAANRSNTTPPYTDLMRNPLRFSLRNGRNEYHNLLQLDACLGRLVVS